MVLKGTTPSKVGSRQAWVKDIALYVLNRQNEDGGYTFCQGTSLNAQDTCYGLEILNLLSIQPPHIQKTIDFLLGIPTYTIYPLPCYEGPENLWGKFRSKWKP